MRGPWFLLALFLGIVRAGACNGDSAFCSMSLYDFTFAGTHNTGSYNLAIPPDFASKGPGIGEFVRSCYYTNHEHDVTQQLDNGIRFLLPDICHCGPESAAGVAGGADAVPWICHAQGWKRGGQAYGETVVVFMTKVKEWLTRNPNEVVLLFLSDTQIWEKGIQISWLDPLKAVFGDCVDVRNSTVAPLQCMWWVSEETAGNMSSQLTLQNLISTGRRLITIPNKIQELPGFQYSWGAANSGYDLDVMYGHVENWAMERTDQGKKHIGMVLDIFGTIKAPTIDFDFTKLIATGNLVAAMNIGGDVRCNRAISKDYNEFFFPGDLQEPKHQVTTANGCEGTCGCIGYRSKLEVLHQTILDRGHNIMGVQVDYGNFGDIAATVKRMNFATFRRRNGDAEPGIPVHKCPWFIGLIVSLSIIVCLGPIVALMLCLSTEQRDRFCSCCRRSKCGKFVCLPKHLLSECGCLKERKKKKQKQADLETAPMGAPTGTPWGQQYPVQMGAPYQQQTGVAYQQPYGMQVGIAGQPWQQGYAQPMQLQGGTYMAQAPQWQAAPGAYHQGGQQHWAPSSTE